MVAERSKIDMLVRYALSDYIGEAIASSEIEQLLAAPQRNCPLYGLVTNGTDFVFLKLSVQEVPRYARSRQFVLEQDHDLEQVLQILKRLAEIVGQEEN
jgi:hypothetical protein